MKRQPLGSGKRLLDFFNSFAVVNVSTATKKIDFVIKILIIKHAAKAHTTKRGSSRSIQYIHYASVSLLYSFWKTKMIRIQPTTAKANICATLSHLPGRSKRRW